MLFKVIQGRGQKIAHQRSTPQKSSWIFSRIFQRRNRAPNYFAEAPESLDRGAPNTYIHMYTYICICMYIYIYREREIKIEREIDR